MVAKTKPARRSHRNSAPGAAAWYQGSQRFTLDNWSGIREFVRFRPEAIVSLQVAAGEQALAQEITEQWRQFQPRLPCPLRIGASERLVCEVELSAQPESELLDWVSSRQPQPPIVVLDHLEDPRNLGSILRSCAYFGIEKVVIAKNRQVGLVPSAVYTSQGGLARTDVVVATNLARCVDRLREAGYWIVGADAGGKPFGQLDRDRLQPWCLVLGNEGRGIGQNLATRLDVVAGIVGPEPTLESLNVSVAAGIMLCALSTAPQS